MKNEAQEATQPRVLVCTNHRMGASVSCGVRGAAAVLTALRDAQIAGRLPDCHIVENHCLGHCVRGPAVRIVGGPFILGVSSDNLDPVIQALRAFAAKGSDDADAA